MISEEINGDVFDIISDIDIHIHNLRGGMMVMSLIIFDIVHQLILFAN